MSTVTLGTLKALAKDYADMTGSSFPVDARLNDYANAELANLRDLLISCNEETLMKVQTVTLSAGVSSYALAADFFKAVKVFLLDNGRRYPIKRFAIEEAAGYNTGAFAGTQVVAGAPFCAGLVTVTGGNATIPFDASEGDSIIDNAGTKYTNPATAGILAGDKFRLVGFDEGNTGTIDGWGADYGGWAFPEFTVVSLGAANMVVTPTPEMTRTHADGSLYAIFWRTTNAVSAGTGASIQAGTIELWYAPQLTRLTADADVMPSQLPEGWEDFVALGMARRLLGKEESPAYAYVKELQAELRQHIIKTASPRDMGEPDSAFVDEGNRFAPHGHANLLEARIFPHQRNLMYRIMNTVITFVEAG